MKRPRTDAMRKRDREVDREAKARAREEHARAHPLPTLEEFVARVRQAHAAGDLWIEYVVCRVNASHPPQKVGLFFADTPIRGPVSSGDYTPKREGEGRAFRARWLVHDCVLWCERVRKSME